MGYLILKLSGILGTKTFSPKIYFFTKILTCQIYTKGYDSSKCAHHANRNNGKKTTNFQRSLVMISFFVVWYMLYWTLLAAHVALYADSGHFVMPPLVSLEKDVWETNAEIEIPHWWHVTTQIWVVLLSVWKFPSTNQSEALLRSG